MNILILTEIYPDKNTYRGSFVKEQALALSSLHQVTVICFEIDHSSFALLPKLHISTQRSKNLNEIRLRLKKTLPLLSMIILLVTTYQYLKTNLLKKHFFEIIHCHISFPAGYMGFLIRKLINKPLVITEHASNFKGEFRTLIHKILILRSLNKADVVIAVGPNLKNEIKEFMTKEVLIIPNVIDVNSFNLIESNHKSIKIGFLGVLNDPRKGLDVLLQAISRIKNQNFTLYVGGSGKMLLDYKTLASSLGIANNCIFTGSVSYENRAAFFEQLDIFVLPSRKESFGVVILEAMACGIPVIATICGGPENFINEKTGYTIPADNVQEMTKALDLMFINLDKFNRLEIRNYVDTNFGVDIFTKKMTTVYKKLL